MTESADDFLPLFHEAVGHVIVAGATFEDAMRYLYARMLDSEVGYLVAAGQTFGQIHTACVAIQKSSGWCHDVETFALLLDEAKTAYESRNHIAHATWRRIGDEKQPVGFRSRHWTIGSTGRQWSIDDMHALAGELETLAVRANAVVGHTYRKPPPNE